MGSGGFFWYVGRSVGFFIKKDIARGRGVQMDCHRWQEGGALADVVWKLHKLL